MYLTEQKVKSTRETGYSNSAKRIKQFEREATSERCANRCVRFLGVAVARHVSITVSMSTYVEARKRCTVGRFIEFYRQTWVLRVKRTPRSVSRTNWFFSPLLFSSLFFSLDAARAWLCLRYTRGFPCVSIGVLNSDCVSVCLLSRPPFSARVVPTRRVATSWRVRNARARTTESSPRPWRELAFVLSQSACARHQPWLRPSSTLVYWLCCENRPAGICLALPRTNKRIIVAHGAQLSSATVFTSI